MPAITSVRTSAVASVAELTSVAELFSMLDLGDIVSTNDLIEAFKKFKLNGGGVEKAPQAFYTSPSVDVVASTLTGIPIDINNIDIDVGRLVGDIEVSKPARRSARRQAPKAHPYRRPTLTKSERILSSHGMAKKGTLVVPDESSLGRIKSIASMPCIKLNNATISLLSNSPPSPDTSCSPFNWSTAWLYSRSATSSSPPAIEAQVPIARASNDYSGDLCLIDREVTVAPVVKNTEPSKQVGKVKKVRVAKGDPYSKDKAARKKRGVTAEV